MRKLFSFLLICFGATMLHAQRPAVRGLFEQMPDSLLPLVNAQARQALTHAYVLGTDALVRDVMNTEVVLDTLGEEFMQLRTSPVSTLQLRLLHTTDSTTLIALVESVEANGSVSSIRSSTTAGQSSIGWTSPCPPCVSLWAMMLTGTWRPSWKPCP